MGQSCEKSGTGGISTAYRTRRKRKKSLKGGVLIFLLLLIVELAAGRNGLFYENSQKKAGTSNSIVEKNPDRIPEFFGEDYVVLNDNIPEFNEEDFRCITGESFGRLDRLGRCGTAAAMLDRTMMPEEERGSIGHMKPSGWVQAKYEGYVDSNPPYLYNRCHLIAYALTGQNANELNLITGTRYFNVSSMLPFERKVIDYLNESENHVLYRVTPYFRGEELVARGVEMEAYSVEDSGEGICFHVFVYNYQPGIEIDYSTGESHVK